MFLYYPHPDDDDDDIEDYGGFSLDLDDILSLPGSSPSRRISFTTSSERDRPFVRPPVKPRARPPPKDVDTLLPFPATSVSALPAEPRVAELQCDSTRTSAAPADLPPPIRARSASRRSTSLLLPPPTPDTRANDSAVLDDHLPPSSPISTPASSSSLSSPLRPSDHTATTREQHLDSGLTLPPSSPIPIPAPSTPACHEHVERVDEMVLDLDSVASPPSPTLDALRITSRVSVRALLNPAPTSAPRNSQFAATAVVESADNGLPQLELPKGGAKVEVASEIEAQVAVEDVDVEIVTDGDVTPLVLPEPEAVMDAQEATEETEVGVEVVIEMAPLESVTEEEVEVQSAAHQIAVREPSPAFACAAVPLPASASMVAVAATTATSRVPSRAPSVAPSASRARTPSFVQGQEIPSSPLSPTPSSIADGDAVFDLMDVDLDAESSALVAGPSRSSHSSRAASPVKAKAKRHAVAEPPRKKARRDNDADISGARTKPKHKIERSRTPTFTDSESEAEVQVQKAVMNVPKRIDAKRLSPEPYPHLAKAAHKKRPRAILSDDETDLDASPAAPPPAPKKDGERERKKDKPKKPRAKGSALDPELENEPLHASMSAAKPKAAKSSSAPKSATNIARPELPSAPVAPAAAKPREAAPHKAKPFTSTAAAGKSRASRAHDDDAESLVNVYELPLPAPELEGMLVETLATARASSLATSALYGALMAARPALRDMALPTLKDPVVADEDDQEKGRDATGRGRGAKADAASRRAWVPAIEAILEAGWRRCGVFGKVVNSGTDLANHSLSLEARWFYDPDRDADADRATLVRSMMRRPGKRSETKKAKQYYWRPLPKISRWDAEDEL